MTEKSYQSNVRLGVTGENTNTCELAAFDRISRVAGISTKLYQAENQLGLEFLRSFEGYGYVPNAIMERIWGLRVQAYRELGVTNYRNIYYGRARTQSELGTALSRLLSGGFRVQLGLWVDDGDDYNLHGVGVLKGRRGHYRVRSTWEPFYNPSHVSLEELFELLAQAPRFKRRPTNSRKTVADTNITALPPELR